MRIPGTKLCQSDTSRRWDSSEVSKIKSSVHSIPPAWACLAIGSPSIIIRPLSRRSRGSLKELAALMRWLLGLEIDSTVIHANFPAIARSKEKRPHTLSVFTENLLVAARGVEPRRLSAPDPKSGVSANFTKRPYSIFQVRFKPTQD